MWGRGRLRQGLVALGIGGSLLLSSCVQPSLDLDFVASQVQGSAPLAVAFTPVFAGEVTSYEWQFGDGGTSSDRSPTHTYAAPGSYTVGLTIRTAQGTVASRTKKGLIRVTAGAPSPLLFWGERGSGRIYGGDRAGTHRNAIATDLISPEDVAVYASTVYWVDSGAGKVECADSDGTNRRAIAASERGVTGIAADRVNSKLYWTCLPSGPSDVPLYDGAIRRSNLDGSNVETLVSFSPSDAFAWQIAVDPVARRLFWISLSWDELNAGTCSGRIVRAGLDGKHPVTILSGLCDPTDLTLDGSTGTASTYVYWTSEDPGSISRARVDGTGVVTLVAGVPAAESVAVDPDEGRMYWTVGTSLQGASLTGSGVTAIYTDLSLPEGIAIDR